MTKFELACQALFTGRMNVPKAAMLCGLDSFEMKTRFVDYVEKRKTEDWQLDITPCWPYA